MPSESPVRFHYIDLLRGLSALAVLIYHYRAFFVTAPDTWPPVVNLPLQGCLWPIYEYGRLAVQVFWVISGFVFAVAYARFGTQMSLWRFFVHRFARLYPLHFVMLILVATIQAASFRFTGHFQVYGSNTPLDFIAQIFLASNWLSAYRFTFNGPVWSVSVEILIYLAFVVYLKLFTPRLLSAGAIAISFFVLAVVTERPVTQCGALFFTGVCIGLTRKSATSRLGIFGVAGLLITLALCVMGNQYQATAALSYLAGPSAVAILAHLDLRLPTLSSRFWWIGDITYAVYLTHMPLIMVVRLLIGDRSVLHAPAGMLAFVLSVVLISVFIHRSFEIPMQRYIRSAMARPILRVRKE